MSCIRLPAVDLAPAGNYTSSSISWTEVLPPGATVTVEAATNGEDFTAVSNGGAIPGLTGGQSLAGLGLTIKVRLTAGIATPIVSGLSAQLVGTNPTLSLATGEYDLGNFKWLTGANKDVAMEVKTWVDSTGTVTLFMPMPFDIAVGDEFEIFPGCNKSTARCGSSLFDNIVNYRGLPFIPGNDDLQRYPNAPGT